ncbi:unnamed protein product [Cladocopium goreaui]|uniref:Uncharacterized protein n=1 Tax=Cladocopium goreaui TaxID=2562237 RepID=A0A9P1GF69_9DINO|nr:unnamed protein product [Cladocopium goreaui]
MNHDWGILDERSRCGPFTLPLSWVMPISYAACFEQKQMRHRRRLQVEGP